MKIYTDEQIKKKVKKINKIKKIVKYITYPIVIFILLICVNFLIQKIYRPDNIPSTFGYKALAITSGSMENTLNIGDLIIIKEPNSEEKLKKGEIITFKSNGVIVTHRISDIIQNGERKEYITKGDNNNSVDEGSIKFKDIEGVYIRKIPNAGYAVMKIQNTSIVIVVVIAAYLIYVFFDRREERRTARHEIRKKMEERKKG